MSIVAAGEAGCSSSTPFSHLPHLGPHGRRWRSRSFRPSWPSFRLDHEKIPLDAACTADVAAVGAGALAAVVAAALAAVVVDAVDADAGADVAQGPTLPGACAQRGGVSSRYCHFLVVAVVVVAAAAAAAAAAGYLAASCRSAVVVAVAAAVVVVAAAATWGPPLSKNDQHGLSLPDPPRQEVQFWRWRRQSRAKRQTWD